MSNTFQENFDISIKFYDDIIAYLKIYQDSIGNPYNYVECHNKKDNSIPDTKENTDMTMYLMNKTIRRICCRVRRFEIYEHKDYFYDIFIRYGLPSNLETEWHKWVDAYGDIMVYGFLSPDESKLIYVRLIDLVLLRKMNRTHEAMYGVPIGLIGELNDGVLIRTLDLRNYPQELILKEYGDYPKDIGKCKFKTFDDWKLSLKPNPEPNNDIEIKI